MVRIRILGAAAALVALSSAAQFPLPIDTSRTIDAGHDHNIAVITSGPNAGQAWAWGGNAGGKLGNGATINSSVPVRVGRTVFTSNIVAVAASQANSYAIDATGTLWAWGDNANSGISGSRLGLGAAPSLDQCIVNGSSSDPCARTPRKVPVPGTPGAGGTPTRKVVQVGAGWGHVVALLDDGSVYTWGDNANGGQLGTGTPTGGQVSPVAVKTGPSTNLTGVVEIAVGYFHTVARLSGGTLVSWGANNEGQLGRGNTTSPNPNYAVAVGVLTAVTSIRTKGATNLALKADGTVWTWGANRYGTTGTAITPGLLGRETSPVQVKSPSGTGTLTGIDRIATGYSNSYARATNGTWYGWGLNNQPEPQLGSAIGSVDCGSSGNLKCVRYPTALTAYANAQRIVGGAAHTLVVKADGTFAIFGNNASGQLANTTGGGGTFGTQFQQFNTWDPDFSLTPQALAGSGSSVGAQSRVGGLSELTLGAGIDFGTQAIGSNTDRTITFENLDTNNITINSIGVAAPFTNLNPANCSAPLGPNGTCAFTVRFTPSSAGSASQTLTISTTQSGEGSTIEVVLVGAAGSVPGSPTNVVATPGNAQATVTFTAPGSDGGSPITGYTVTSNPAGGVDSNAGTTATSHTITGLTNGTAYTFTVKATNAVGDSAPSAPSNSVTPQNGFALTVTKNGSGAGSVTSSPSGIDCGATCAFLFAINTPVTLSATPAAGTTFSGWSGSGCSGTGTCQVTMSAARAVTATFDTAPRLFNISTRMQVLTNNDVMIAGFIVGGAVSKTVVINVAGPSLVPFGIANALMNPTLSLVRSSDQVTLATNDNWQTQANPANVAAIQASGFQPNNAAEPAIIATLAPGAYTAIVQGSGNTTGVGLVGVFEVDHPEIPLINISTRGQVLTGNDVMIAGIIVQGSGPQKVVINVAGPSLVPFGIPNALGNPTLTLVRSSDQQTLATNDDWQTQTNPADVAAIQATGFQPNHALEPAIIATLPPGAYTAIVSGVSNTTGVGLVGVFAVP